MLQRNPLLQELATMPPARTSRARGDRAAAMADYNRLRLIINTICERYHITPSQLGGRSREWKYVFPRWLAIHLITTQTSYDRATIATFFDRCKSDIHYSLRAFARQVEAHPKSSADLAAIEATLSLTPGFSQVPSSAPSPKTVSTVSRRPKL